jgi:hypothetical protein
MWIAVVYDAATDAERVYGLEGGEAEARVAALELLSGVGAGWVELWGEAGEPWVWLSPGWG